MHTHSHTQSSMIHDSHPGLIRKSKLKQVIVKRYDVKQERSKTVTT